MLAEQFFPDIFCSTINFYYWRGYWNESLNEFETRKNIISTSPLIKVSAKNQKQYFSQKQKENKKTTTNKQKNIKQIKVTTITIVSGNITLMWLQLGGCHKNPKNNLLKIYFIQFQPICCCNFMLKIRNVSCSDFWK